MPAIVELSRYLPILSTIISAAFAYVIFDRYRQKPQAYQLLWWGIGIVAYGAGTLIESINTLLGWHTALFKAWYIAGALLGGAPLALGTVYLLWGKRAGHVAVVLLAGHMALYRALMFGRSELTRIERETIAVAVSVANHCHY